MRRSPQSEIPFRNPQSAIRIPYFSIDTCLRIGHPKNFIEGISRIRTGYGERAEFLIVRGSLRDGAHRSKIRRHFGGQHREN
jgi:hypothetical protein